MFNTQYTYNIINNRYRIPILPYSHPVEYITGKLLIYRVRIYSQKALSRLSRPQIIGLKPPPYCNTRNFLHTLPHLKRIPPWEWSFPDPGMVTHSYITREKKITVNKKHIQLVFNKINTIQVKSRTMHKTIHVTVYIII